MAATFPGPGARRVHSSWLGLAAIVFHGCGLGSDSEHCNQKVLPDVIDVRFVPELTEPGEYRIDFASSALTGTCAVTIGGNLLEPCSSAHLIVEGETASGEVTLAALRAWFDHGPSSFELTLSSASEVRVAGRYEPRYELEEPQGAGCGERQRAEVTVSIP
ncbi:MAG: hypothetical protein QM784_26030 [Polyangiaceae bacterium]